MTSATRSGYRLAVVYDVAYPFVNGGGQKRLFEVATRLVAHGWEVTWFCFQTWEGGAIRREHGIEYYGLPGFSSLYTQSGRRSIKEALAFGFACFKARREIRARDIIWCGVFPYFHLVALLPPNGPHTVIDWWEAWGSLWFRYLGAAGLVGRIMESLVIKLYARIGLLVVPSQSTRDNIIRLGARPQGVIVIPLGVDLQEVARVPPSSETTDLVYVGRLKDHKNVDHILCALRLLRDRGDLKLRLAIVGDGPERPRLELLTSELDLGDQVQFLGALSNDAMFATLKAARLSMHPSTKEGGGSIALIEANACGTPMMIYRHPAGIDPSLITTGVNGWIVEEVGPEHVAARLHEVVGSGALDRLDRTACARVVADFDWELIASRYGYVFTSYLAPASNSPGQSALTAQRQA